MKAALQLDLTGHTYREISVENFVENVWGLDNDKIQKIMAEKLVLAKDPLDVYESVLNTAGKKENDLHEPFCKIATGLLDDICKLFGMQVGSIRTGFWDYKGDTMIRSQETDRKPDMADVFLPIILRVIWQEVRSVIAFKLKRNKPPTNGRKLSDVQEHEPLENVTPDTHSRPSFSCGSGSRVKEVGDVVAGRQCHHTSKNNRSATQHLIATSAGTSRDTSMTFSSSTNYTSTQSTRKRSRDGDDQGCRKRKRGRRSIKITDDQMQLATYALECLGASSRHYTTGIFIDKRKVSLWYYDRTAVIRTVNFDFTTEKGASYLGLTLFALGQCDLRQAGFDPHIHKFIRPAQPDAVILESDIQPLDKPPVETVHVCAKSSTEMTSVCEECPRTMSGVCSKCAKELAEACRMCTKKTTSICYRFPKSEGKPDYVFPVSKVLATYRGINGRGTYVASVYAGRVGSKLRNSLYALKMSWQYISRTHEGDLLQTVRAALPPYWQKRLPNPLFYAKYTSEELGLPSSKMKSILEDPNAPDNAIQGRDLHALVSNLYVPLWEAKNVEEFKRVFLDCVECHYHVFTSGRVIHRDISQNNLMIWRPGQTDRIPVEDSVTQNDHESVGGRDTEDVEPDDDSKDISSASPPIEEQETIGVLNDLDLGMEVNDKGEPPLSANHHRTGTFPFMARDLLKPKLDIPHHLYRHDLESFFYILIWAATHYDFNNQVQPIKPTPKILRFWADETHAYDHKVLLYYGDDFEAIQNSTLSAFNEMWAKWIKPLWVLFRSAFSYVNECKEQIKAMEGQEGVDRLLIDCGGPWAIGETPRGLNPDFAVTEILESFDK
ncbi:hypothetical protein BDZ97DRAFT_1865056 [Flammula alnicola]|nr:hypothetical protein BDZ97DRAFT_1865056 [Flammula alnicola]